MITAVDSSVILDVLTGEQAHASGSLAAMRKASPGRSAYRQRERDCRSSSSIRSNSLFEEFLADWGLEFIPSTLHSSIRVGEMLRQMLARKKRHEGRILPDFLIGAHALEHADRLLAGIEAFYADYFTDLVLWDPSR